jgi:nitrite reductase (NO-forming)
LKKSIFGSEPIKKVFILGLSVGLVIGIITSTLLFLPPTTHTSFSYFSKDAKAISGISRASSGIYQAPNRKVEVTLVVERANVKLCSKEHPMQSGVLMNFCPSGGDIAPLGNVWTFNGTVPGPTLRFKEGDNVTIHLINLDPKRIYHTVHLHVDHAAKFDGIFDTGIDGSIAYGPSQQNHGKPNSTDYTFIAEPAGAFPYHCHSMSEAGTSMHMRMGMYGLMIIDPKVPLEPAREYGIVMGEYSPLDNYSTRVDLTLPTGFKSFNDFNAAWHTSPQQLQQGTPPGTGDKIISNFKALMTILPKYFLNNGYSDQYLDHPLPAWQNELVRLYVVNDGVGLVYPFHIHAQIFKAYPSGLIRGDGWSNKPEYRQTVLIGPGDASIIEIKWPQPGSYLFHAHGIEEENGGMGCFDILSNSTGFNDNKTKACGMPPDHSSGANITEIKNAYPSIKTIVTNKTGSISMIKSQYMQQIALQHPTCLESKGSLFNGCKLTHFVSTGGPAGPGYSPRSLTITHNDTVAWSNEDPLGLPPVTVSSDPPGAFDSGDVQPGHTFGHIFKTPGTYKYHDKHHPSNTGEIIVT